jgi:hydrogenase maturation protease
MVGAWGLEDVRTVAVHQLTPELAATFSDVDAVLFIDAATTGHEPELVRLEPAVNAEGLAHAGDPGALLALAAAVYGRCPRAALLTIPGRHFDFGSELSGEAAAALQQAVPLIRGWIDSGGAG